MFSVETSVLKAVLGSQLDQIDHMEMRSILDSQLYLVSPLERESMAVKAANAVNDFLKQAGISRLPEPAQKERARLDHHLDELRREGITLLGPVLDVEQVKQVHRHLKRKPVYTGFLKSYCDPTPRVKDEVQETYPQAVYKLTDFMESPHLLEIISSPFLLKLVEKYLGVIPTAIQSNAFWSFPNKHGIAQNLHRDWNGFRHCVLFVYLTDVCKKTGAHQFIRNSHRAEVVIDAIKKHRSLRLNVEELFVNGVKDSGPGDAEILEVFGENLLTIERPAGFAFLADPFGLHRGLPLLEGERLLFWSRFGIYDNGCSYDVEPDPLKRAGFANRIPDDITHRYIFRPQIESEFTLQPTELLDFRPSLNRGILERRALRRQALHSRDSKTSEG